MADSRGEEVHARDWCTGSASALEPGLPADLSGLQPCSPPQDASASRHTLPPSVTCTAQGAGAGGVEGAAANTQRP